LLPRLAWRITPFVPARALHQLLKLLALFGRKHGAELFAGLLQFLAHVRVNAGTQLPDPFLTLGDDTANLLALFGGEIQMPLEDLNKLPAQQSGRVAGIRRPGGIR
jgi:hypothetical protein